MKRHFGGYRRTYTFGYTCLVYHATTLFCRRFCSYRDDPLGKTTGQMVGAARSARQNQVEASARRATSSRQEILQLDVAKGSLDELAGDYEAFILDHGEVPWSDQDPRAIELSALRIDKFEGGDDLLNKFGSFILSMRSRFAPWLENEDAIIASNSLLRIIYRTMGLLQKQIETNRGGEVERHNLEGCPKCGGELKVRTSASGRQFLGCSNFPTCDFTRSLPQNRKG